MGVPFRVSDHEALGACVLLENISDKNHEEVHLDSDSRMRPLVRWSPDRQPGRVPADLFLLEQAVGTWHWDMPFPRRGLLDHRRGTQHRHRHIDHNPSGV